MKNWLASFRKFAHRKDVQFSLSRYFVGAMGRMALGLFATLLIGTILDKVGELTGLLWLREISKYASSATGPVMAAAIGLALNAPPLVVFSLGAVGLGANTVGGPLAVLITSCFAAELGKLVCRETKLDILVTPLVTILAGLGLNALVGPGVQKIMTDLGELIRSSTALQPFWMGIVVSVIMGIVLTLPISSAAICAALTLTGLAGGAATAGCCAQMVGFAVLSFRENRWGGVAAQGLGTSMLQMGNIVRNPRVWIPPTLASAITGPIATCVFKMENGIAIASGMGTCGLVGPLGVISADGFGSAMDWIGMLLVCIVLPAVLTAAFGMLLRKIGWIKDGDLKLDL